MSSSHKGRSTIWDAKTRKKTKRNTSNSMLHICREVDKAYHAFWAKRKTGPYGA